MAQEEITVKNLCFLLVLLALLRIPCAWASDEERKLQAVFIGRLASYIEWPVQQRESFVITLLGDNPFGSLLDHLYRDKSIHGKPIVLRYAHRLEEVPPDTDILFLTLARSAERQAAIEYAKAHHILTVGSTKGFAESGGIIQLDFVEQRARIKINHDAAMHAGLRIGAPLLSIATVLRGVRP